MFSNFLLNNAIARPSCAAVTGIIAGVLIGGVPSIGA
jgi:hypothetical protein